MKTLRNLLLLIIAAFTFAACETESPEEKAITLTDGKTEYTVDSGEQSITISFSTTAEWETFVEDVTEGSEETAADWISLSSTSGSEAGQHSLEIRISGNDSESQRKAIVTLNCRETVVIIIITQKGKGEVVNPGTAKPAKELRLYSLSDQNSIRLRNGARKLSATSPGTKAGSYASVFLKMDSKNRVIKTTNALGETMMEFAYDTDMLTLTTYEDNQMINSIYGYENGRVTRGISSTEGENEDTFEYTSDGYLSQYKTQGVIYENGGNIPTYFNVFYKYTWANGCFTELHNYSDNTTSAPLDEMHTFEYLPSVSGISNVCLSNILIDCDMWSIYRLAGNSCDKLISKMVRNGETTTYEYEFDKDGAVSKVYVNNGSGYKEFIEILY